MNKVLCFGEILLRLQTEGQHFFEKDHNCLRIYPGGSEANVAVGLSQMGTATAYCSVFPENALSTAILQTLHCLQVDPSKSLHLGDRIGSYILLSADGLSQGEVIYDRRYSGFSMLVIDDLDFDLLFQGIDWLHWTALTPALNESLAELMEQILIEAAKRHITISVDLNYRSKLWQYGTDPTDIMPQLVKHCEVIMGNIWAANKMLGIPVAQSLHRHTPVETYFEEAKKSATAIFSRYPSAKHIAYTFRFMDNPRHHLFYGTYHSRKDSALSAIYETMEVVDRIGSGDAFMAGLIHALRLTDISQEIVAIATKAGYEKLFVEGDFGNGRF